MLNNLFTLTLLWYPVQKSRNKQKKQSSSSCYGRRHLAFEVKGQLFDFTLVFFNKMSLSWSRTIQNNLFFHSLSSFSSVMRANAPKVSKNVSDNVRKTDNFGAKSLNLVCAKLTPLQTWPTSQWRPQIMCTPTAKILTWCNYGDWK